MASQIFYKINQHLDRAECMMACEGSNSASTIKQVTGAINGQKIDQSIANQPDSSEIPKVVWQRNLSAGGVELF